MDDIEVARYAVRTFKTPLAPPGDLEGSVGVFRPVGVRTVTNCWADGTCTAICARPYFEPPHKDKEVPVEICTCGIYGCLSLEHLIFQYPIEARDIIAVIAAEGKTILGDRGLRTQYARVVAYWTRKWPVAAADQFKDAQAFTDLYAMAEAYGIPRQREDAMGSVEDYRSYYRHFTGSSHNGWPKEFGEIFDPRNREWVGITDIIRGFK